MISFLVNVMLWKLSTSDVLYNEQAPVITKHLSKLKKYKSKSITTCNEKVEIVIFKVNKSILVKIVIISLS